MIIQIKEEKSRSRAARIMMRTSCVCESNTRFNMAMHRILFNSDNEGQVKCQRRGARLFVLPMIERVERDSVISAKHNIETVISLCSIGVDSSIQHHLGKKQLQRVLQHHKSLTSLLFEIPVLLFSSSFELFETPFSLFLS